MSHGPWGVLSWEEPGRTARSPGWPGGKAAAVKHAGHKQFEVWESGHARP